MQVVSYLHVRGLHYIPKHPQFVSEYIHLSQGIVSYLYILLIPSTYDMCYVLYNSISYSFIQTILLTTPV